MKRENYIPGFDWAKMVGCVLIVAAHAFLNSWASQVFSFNVNNYLGTMVPVYFMMSGYLLSQGLPNKASPKGYVCRYIWRYLVIYYIAATLTLLIQYYYTWKSSGIFMIKDMIYVLITMPVLSLGPAQLWFIPPLLLGIYMAYRWNRSDNKTQWFRFLAVVTVVFILFTESYDYLAYSYLPILKTEGALIVTQVVSRYLRGIFFTLLGMVLQQNRDRLMSYPWRRMLAILLVLMPIELLLFVNRSQVLLTRTSLSFSVVWGALLLMRGLLAIRSQILLPYHREVTIFNGLNFFGHILEFRLLQVVVHSDILVFVLTVTCNLFITILISAGINKRINVNEKNEMCLAKRYRL